jgi:putative hemolysin
VEQPEPVAMQRAGVKEELIKKCRKIGGKCDVMTQSKGKSNEKCVEIDVGRRVM